MSAHCSYAVFTTRADTPGDDLLAAAKVPALDPSTWQLGVRDLATEATLREILSTLAFEHEPPISRRRYPSVPSFRQAVVVEVDRDDSLYPDALAFATEAVTALLRWAGGPVVDLSAERLWLTKEWDKKLAGRPFDARKHISIHSSWAADGRTATLHTHGMAKFAHSEFVALDVPDEGVRAVGQLIGHLADVRARTLEPLEPGHAFDPGFGQPMVAFVTCPAEHPVNAHLGAPPSVLVDYDVDSGEAVDGLYGLLRVAKALDRPVPEHRRRWPVAHGLSR